MPLLEKNQTGLACEFYVAGELTRLGYNVTITFGNTKAIDLLVQKGDDVCKVQVKGMQRTKSICWNLDKSKVTDDIYLVLVNLHADDIKRKPEFFVLRGSEAKKLFKDSPSQGEKRTYLDYNAIKRLPEFEDRWSVFDQPIAAKELEGI